jgi:mannose-6-phosphate isomerase
MWYILECDNNAKIYTGFSKPFDKETYLEAVRTGTLDLIMNVEQPAPGDVFFVPAGRIHAIGTGNLLVEIQQTSDITYRIFDWNRKDNNGKSRELHTDLALDAIDFKAAGRSKISKDPALNKTENLVNCEFFTTNIINFNHPLEKDYNLIDSFVIYICTKGEFIIRWEDNSEPVIKGETVLLPAMIKEVILEPSPEATLLEVFINSNIKLFNKDN